MPRSGNSTRSSGVRNPSLVIPSIYHRLYSAFGPQHWWPADTPLEVIVGAVLTQNTSWKNVEYAIANLRQRGLLNLTRLSRIPAGELAAIIRPAGFYNLKARRLLSVIHWLGANGGLRSLSRVRTLELRRLLLACPGIGPETADSILLYALDRPVFVIDAYTRRILYRYGLATGDETYDHLQSMFHTAVPCNLRRYNEFHALLVQLAKTHCRAKPLCCGCPLA